MERKIRAVLSLQIDRDIQFNGRWQSARSIIARLELNTQERCSGRLPFMLQCDADTNCAVVDEDAFLRGRMLKRLSNRIVGVDLHAGAFQEEDTQRDELRRRGG